MHWGKKSSRFQRSYLSKFKKISKTKQYKLKRENLFEKLIIVSNFGKDENKKLAYYICKNVAVPIYGF